MVMWWPGCHWGKSRGFDVSSLNVKTAIVGVRISLDTRVALMSGRSVDAKAGALSERRYRTGGL